MFADQSYLQTALVALAGYGVLTLLVVLFFRLLRSLATARAPRTSAREHSAPRRTPPAEPTEQSEAAQPESP